MFFKLKIFYYFLLIKLYKLSGFYRTSLFRKIQKRRLYHSLKKSTFYNKQLQNVKFVERFDTINKTIFMDNFDDINIAGITLNKAMEVALNAENSKDYSNTIGTLSVGLSTGTSGSRGIFLVSENDRARWVAYILDRVIGFSFSKKRIAFFLRADNKLYQSVNSRLFEFNFFDVQSQLNNHLSRLNKLQPDILIAQPSVLIDISKEHRKGRIEIKPTKIISVAEVLTKEDKSFIEDTFKTKLAEVYQCTEGFLASSCSEGSLHFNEDFLIIEKNYIDKERKRFHPIITDLLRKTQPVIRYELNDIITEKKHCKCNNPHMAILNIEGRSDDSIKLKNKKNKEIIIYPDLIRRTIVLSDSLIKDYQVTYKDGAFMIYIDSKDENSFFKAQKALENKLNSFDVYEIPIIKSKEILHIQGKKKRRVLNLTHFLDEQMAHK